MERWRERARALLRAHLHEGARIGVATSGGPDSQALLHLVATWREELGIAHLVALGVDHGLRPDARAELQLARNLAVGLGAEFRELPVRVATHGNVLDAARRSRYAALQAAAAREGLDWLLVAHSATDVVETMLMRLSRGNALRSLAGIPRRRGKILRPLLEASRDELLAYVEAAGIAYARDPSNVDRRRARAQIRHEALPALRALGFDLERSLARVAREIRQEDRALERWARTLRDAARGPLGALRLVPIRRGPVAVQRRVLRGWLEGQGLRPGAASLERLRRMLGGGPSALSVGGANLRLERGYLWPPTPPGYALELAAPGRVDLETLGIGLVAEVTPLEGPEAAQRLLDEIRASAGQTVAFSADRPHFDLQARSWHPGDSLRPYGLRGRTKVGDLFTDLKIPRAIRHHWPLVYLGDELLWVVGLRRGGFAPLGPASRRALVLRYEGELPWGAPGAQRRYTS